jgi:predicted transcriptional regulator
MVANPTQKPTDSELEILRILWNKGPSSVRFVNNELGKKRKVGYTTTLKIMQIMFVKGMLGRKEKGNKHIYTAKIQEEQTQRILLDKFVDSAFGGSAMQLVMQALGRHKTTDAELEELKKLIERLEEKNK